MSNSSVSQDVHNLVEFVDDYLQDFTPRIDSEDLSAPATLPGLSGPTLCDSADSTSASVTPRCSMRICA